MYWIWAYCKVLNLYMEARIRIRIRVKVKGRIWIRIIVKGRICIRIRIKVTSRIRIRRSATLITAPTKTELELVKLPFSGISQISSNPFTYDIFTGWSAMAGEDLVKSIHSWDFCRMISCGWWCSTAVPAASQISSNPLTHKIFAGWSAVVGDGVLRCRQRHRSRQIHQSTEPQGGLDRIHLQVKDL